MSELEAKTTLQSDLGTAIDKLNINFGKDSKDRKTKEYLESRLHTLEELWNEFESNDDEIRKLCTDPSSHVYFIKEYYNQVEQVYLNLKSKIQNLLHEKQNDREGKASTHEKQPTTSNAKLKELGKSIQLIMKTLQEILNKAENPEFDSVTVHEHMIIRTEKFMKLLEEKEKEISLLAKDVEMPFSVVEYQDILNKAEEVLIILKMKVSQNKPSSFNNSAITVQPSVKLNQISIPKFNGDHSKWQQFNDLFDQLVHQQQDISKAVKMFYLKDNVSGEAEQAIRHLMVSEMNYDIAWAILKEKYDDKRATVHSWLKRIVEQKAITTVSSENIKRLHDSVKEATLAIDSLNIPPKILWEGMVMFLTSNKLDATSRTLYEQALHEPQELQSLESFMKFLQTRYRSLNVQGVERPRSSHTSMTIANKEVKEVANKCTVCNRDHPIYFCEQFKNMSVTDRNKAVLKAKLCLNCLKKGHFANKCSSRTCVKCGKRHNTLLHSTYNENKQSHSRENEAALTTATHQGATEIVSATLNVQNLKTNNDMYAMLGTAIIDVKDYDGKWVQCRALLDPGSQVHIASERLQKKLKLDAFSVNSRIVGLGESRININNRLNLQIQSKTTSFGTTIEVLVMKKITLNQPQHYVPLEGWNIPKHMNLADPRFNIPQGVDLLLGVGLYGDLILPTQYKLGTHLPVLQESTLGWIVMGALKTNQAQEDEFCGVGTIDLEEQITKFWDLEDYIPHRRFTTEELRCETLFNATTIKHDGRFVVKIPFQRSPTVLGESRNVAYSRLLGVERKLKKNKELHHQYVMFMREYENEGHMEDITSTNIEGPHYYMPHHCVVKPSSSTTKLRVVFDASAKCNNNISLNEIMFAGPRIQDELFGILLRFRLKKYVFTADIQKMYRQILVAPEDRNCQLILWREDDSLPLKTYRLRTVTYGTKAAPYLATKCLQRLAEDEETSLPNAARVMRDFYVDDILTGADHLTEATKIQEELRQLLARAGFKLRKWCANHPQLLENIPNEDLELKLNFHSKEDGYTRPLGLTWHPVSDHFQITVNLKPHDMITKRSVLSSTATLFDPLGLVNPVIVLAKIFMQQLWRLKVDWDEELPANMKTEWRLFEDGLTTLNEIMVPRYMYVADHTGFIALHAFADASERAYGVAIYLRSINKAGEVIVRLLCARSRVAPLKQTKLPLLELCAAKLAAEVVNAVNQHLGVLVENIYYWTDSEIVLSWINRDAATLKTFVANRIGDIQSLSNTRKWRYVPSELNPADLVSRGCTPQQLISSKKWFSGPEFLKGSQMKWPVQPQDKVIMKEFERTLKCILTVNQSSLSIVEEINHGNSFRKLRRIVAWIIRAIDRFKAKRRHSTMKTFSPAVLKAVELDKATNLIFKLIQQPAFSTEISSLSRNQPLPKGSNLSSLTPFLDHNGLLRVGGRLQQSSLTYDEKHPIMLPHKHFITRLYMVFLHVNNLHAGPQALTAISRQRVWIPQARQVARSIVNSCIRCVKVQPKLANQIMGQLPTHRVTPARPFINCGVDFFGPMWTHFTIRGKKPQKTYVAVFCCFATKALHLEVVANLTTDAFIGALKRFASRRGSCQNMYCDNAKNFVGANNKLSELQTTIFGDSARENIANHCSERRIQFHFIPPRSPHMGGLWEAAVKSAKNLLIRTITSTALTYEELCTVTAEIEAVLNSRPISAMSSDPNDLNALTPGHFLIGEPLTATVDPHASLNNLSLLSRWQLVSFCRGEFWKRWSSEYLTHLQQRAKWAKEYPNMMPGTMVIIKEDNLPPLQWALGRIIDIITGPDGHARVADVRTSSGTIRRAIHRLAPLPIDSIENESEQVTADTSTNGRNDETKKHRQDREDVAKVPNRKRRRSSPTLTITTAIINALCILPLVFASQVTIQQLEHNAGIYYNPKGQVLLSPTQWTIMAYARLDGFEAMEEGMTNVLDRMKKIAIKMPEQDLYNDIITYFEEQLQKAKQYKEVILYEPTTLLRMKRAAFNFGGTILNRVFGVLDEDYAEDMRQIINKVQHNEEALSRILTNHTSMFDATINIFKRDRQEIRNHLLQIQQMTKQRYDSLVNQINTEIAERKMTDMFSLMSTLATSYLKEYSQIQDTIADITFGLAQGHTSLHIISPHQLKEQLSLIMHNLPISLRVPQTQQPDLRTLYRVMTTQGRVLGGLYLFKIQIPLVAENQFQLYQLLPIPVIINKTKLTIKTSTDYLATDLRNNQFYSLSETEIHRCITLTDDRYLCHQEGPMEDEYDGRHQCESELMLAKELPPSCALTYSEARDTWTRIGITGSWLFSLSSPCDITIVCEDGLAERRTIQESGILSLKKGCTMKAKSVSLTSYQDLITTINLITQPQFNLRDVNLSSVTTTKTRGTRIDTEFDVDTDLMLLETKIDTLKNQQIDLMTLQPTDIHQFSISYAALVLIIVLLIFVGYQQRQHQCKKPQSATTGDPFVLSSLACEEGQDVELN